MTTRVAEPVTLFIAGAGALGIGRTEFVTGRSGHLIDRGMPQPDGAVETARCEGMSVRCELHRRHGRRVPGQTQPLLAGLDVPEPDGLVLAARDERLPIGREGQVLDGIGMPPKGTGQLPAGAHLPELDRPPVVPGRQRLAIGRERDGLDPTVQMRLQNQFFAAGEIPEPDAIELRPRGQLLAVRRERHRGEAAAGYAGHHVGLQDGAETPRGQVPHLHDGRKWNSP